MHLFVRVIGRRVFDNRDLLAELSAKANRRFDASGGYQTDHDELMDAVLLELQIQIGHVQRTSSYPRAQCGVTQ